MNLLQVAQRATDLKRAADFYSRLLEIEPTAVFDPPGLAFFRLGEVRLLIDRGAPSALIYLQVADVHATVDRLRGEEVEVVTEPHIIFQHQDDSLGPAGTQEWMAFIRDSEDNTVGLVSHLPSKE